MGIIRRSCKGSHDKQVVEWLADHLLFDVTDISQPFWGTSSSMATDEMHRFQELQIDYVHLWDCMCHLHTYSGFVILLTKFIEQAIL
jgi:hypothetical protein